MRSLLTATSESYLRFQDRDKKNCFLNAPEVQDCFEKSRCAIQNLLAETQYFHGTGARHYVNNGSSKYDGTGADARDSLKSFLKDGLQPREDLYNQKFRTGAKQTISLTQSRVYARLYSELFLCEGKSLAYEYGPRSFWWKVFLVKMIRIHAIAGLKSRLKGEVNKRIGLSVDERERRRRERKRKEKKWTDSIRKDGKYSNDPMGAILRAKSDIQDNHPVIIGVRQGAIQTLHMPLAGVRAYEARTDRVIQPDQFTHLQVPIKNLEESRQTAKSIGLDLPIIPIEFAELIDSEIPLEELTRPHI